jgi:very-short-patch-repair endonuclease
MSLKQAKRLRGNMTDAERRLWYRLRAHRFGGVKVKRQVPIGPYVVDFACLSRKLVLEVDGGQHSENEADRIREQRLQEEGFKVLRFWNNDVLKQTDTLLEMIMVALDGSSQGSPSPGARSLSSGRASRGPVGAPPSPQGERGKSARGEIGR